MRVMKLAHALSAAALATSALGCHPTSHPVVPSEIGVPRSSSALEAVVDSPGPVEVETVVGCDWSVDRAGLVNLDHPAARAANLKDGLVPIHVAFHAIRHPSRGLWLVDTGIERAMRDAPDEAAASGLVARFMGVDRMKFRTDTASWLARQGERPAGVFLTHLHLDHVSGMRDVPDGTPVWVGQTEATETSIWHAFTRGIADDALKGKGALREWRFERDPDGMFAGVLDVFGDATVWAIAVPGHTAGSTAFVVRTPKGPVLLTGDASHTAWGFQHGVEPGWFSSDKPMSARSLAALERFVARHPRVDVRLGHQAMPADGAPAAP